MVLLPEVFAALFLRLARSTASTLGGGGGGGRVSGAGSRCNAGDTGCGRGCGRWMRAIDGGGDWRGDDGGSDGRGIDGGWSGVDLVKVGVRWVAVGVRVRWGGG